MSDEVKASFVPSFSSHPMGREEGETFVLGYMDKVDWECEVGMNSHNTVFSDPEGVRSRKGCAEGCGIVEIKMEFVRVVQEGYGGLEPIPGVENEELLNFREVEAEDRKPFSEIKPGKRFGYRGDIYIKVVPLQFSIISGWGLLVGSKGILFVFPLETLVVPLEK